MGTSMLITIIDGQGGGMGRQLVAALKAACPMHTIACVGTNSQATAAMLKAGADQGATGENAVLVACRRSDILIGPIGIVIADSLHGEISPAMAKAVGQSEAQKLLLPVNLCCHTIVGMRECSIGTLVQETVEAVLRMV